MRVHLYTSLGAVKMGLDILMEDEKVKVERIMGHGGFFKTKGVGQRYLAADTGVTGKHVDVCLPDHEDTVAHGVRIAEVWVSAE